MPQMSQVVWEHAIDTLTGGKSNRAGTRSFNVNFSTISRLRRRLREFAVHPTGLNHRPREGRRVGERFDDVNHVNRVPHGEGGVMVWAGISYGQ